VRAAGEIRRRRADGVVATEGLVKRGDEVSLTSADSRTAAKLRPMCEGNIPQAMARGEAYQYESWPFRHLSNR
jgi:hypothetical protein